jgi:hypothetical protein
LRTGIDSHDIEVLKIAVEECQAAGMAENALLTEAVTEKRKIEQIMAKLGVAVHLQDIEVLREAIGECKAAGIPARDVDGAVNVKVSIEKLLAELKSAIDQQNSDGIKAAIGSCPIDMLKTAVEQCHLAGLPEKQLEDAISSKLLDVKESERSKYLEDLKTCNDGDRRAKRDEAVNLLKEAIRSGSDVPPHFEELVNELIVSQVM